MLQLYRFSVELLLDFAQVDGWAAAAAFGASGTFVRHEATVNHPAHVGHCHRENQENDELLYHIVLLCQLHKDTKSLEAVLDFTTEGKKVLL